MKVLGVAIFMGLILTLFAFNKAMEPAPVAMATSEVDAATRASDAHRRINLLQHDIVGQRWMALVSVAAATLCCVAAWQAWVCAKHHGAAEALEARLTALESRQPVFLPTPTQESLPARTSHRPKRAAATTYAQEVPEPVDMGEPPPSEAPRVVREEALPVEVPAVFQGSRMPVGGVVT